MRARGSLKRIASPAAVRSASLQTNTPDGGLIGGLADVVGCVEAGAGRVGAVICAPARAKSKAVVAAVAVDKTCLRFISSLSQIFPSMKVK